MNKKAKAQPQLQPATKTPRSNQLTYAPTVEANRADYERLAEAWITMADIESKATDETAAVDLEGYEVDGAAPVMRAFHEHFHDLVFDSFNWFDPRLMRAFYPEMRLAIDQFRWEARRTKGKASRAA